MGCMIALLKSGCICENHIANQLEGKYHNVPNQSAEFGLGKHLRDDSIACTYTVPPQKQQR